METHDDIIKLLQTKPMFKLFKQEDLTALIQAGSLLTYEDTDNIITEGEHSHDFFVVISGCVNVCVTEACKEVFICTIGEGEIFGEAGIFSKVKRTASVQATEGTTILRLHRDNFLTFLKTQPQAGMKLLMIIIYSLLRKLREVNQELAFERKFDIAQDDIDAIIQGIMEE